jgi:superfamily II DNA or RNA helicase
MKLIIDNQLSLLDIPEDLTDWFKIQLTFTNPKFEEAMERGRYLGNIPQFIRLYRELPNGIVIPRGYLQIVEDSMIGRGLGLKISDSRILLPPISVESTIELWPHQKRAKQSLLSQPNGMLIAPAASGKTIMGLDVFASVRQKMLWITHTNRLAEQAIDRIMGVFPDVSKEEIGFLGSGKFTVGDRITIGMVQTLVRRPSILPKLGKEFGLVIVDEAHHVPATIFTKVLNNFSSYYLYGLTATPYRRDKMEDIMFATMGLANAVVARKKVKEQGKIMTPSVIKRVIPSAACGSNDYHYIIREMLMRNENRLSIIATDVIREAMKVNFCIVINTRKKYCEMLFETISKHWTKTVIATGDYSRQHNDEQVAKLEEGKANVLITTFELLGEGFDVKKLNRGFIALPFKEKARVEQAVGRIQRTCLGKIDAIMYDYVDEDIGILKNQWFHREAVYKSLGMEIVT